MSKNTPRLQTTWIALSVMAASSWGVAAEAQILDSPELGPSAADLAEVDSIASSLEPQAIAQAALAETVAPPEASSPVLTFVEIPELDVSPSKYPAEPLAESIADLLVEPLSEPDLALGMEDGTLEMVSPEIKQDARSDGQAVEGQAVEGQAVEIQRMDHQTPAPQVTAQELEALEERLRQLEERQQDLLEEIDDLKGQLQEQVTEPAEGSGSAIAAEIIDIKSSSHPQGLYLSGEVVLLEPTPGDKLDFAITDPGVALTTSGQVQAVEYEQQANTRIGVGYRKGDVDVRATHLKIESNGHAEAESPNSGFLFSTLTHPAQNDQADTAKASAELTYNTTDLEVGYSLQANEQFDLRLSAGLRFADTNQQLQVAYDGVDFTNAEARFKHDFAGFGPKLGADLRWKLGSGFSAFGRASGSLLMGDARTSYRETDNDGTTLVGEVTQRDNDRILPVAEMALGLDWTGQLTDNLGLSLAGGYEYQNWFNAFNNVQFVDNASPGVFTDSDEDMGFKGFFFKTSLSLDF